MFYDRLAEACKAQGTTVTGVCKEIGVGTANGTYWKKGSIPNGEVLIKLSEFLGVSIDYLLTGKIHSDAPVMFEELPFSEQKLLDAFRKLDEANQHYILSRTLYQLGKQERLDKLNEEHPELVAEMLRKATIDSDAEFEPIMVGSPSDRELPLFDFSASAGTGTFLDSSDYILITLPASDVPISTSFCINCRGDSMMPEFQEEDLLFVKQQPTLENGELGVFILNTHSYFKKYIKEGEQPYLLSLNQKYEPIKVNEHDDIRVVGKVIGKYREPQDETIPEVYTAARDGGGFEKVTDPDQARALSRVIRQRKRSNKKLP